MRRLVTYGGVGLGALLLCAALVWAQSRTRRTDVWDFVNGLYVAEQAGKAVSGTGTTLTVGSSSHTSAALTAGTMTITVDAVGVRDKLQATETIASAGTITANACGGLKRVTAAGAVTTNLTNTFTAPAAANEGCLMMLCNVGANAITLDANANFKPTGGLDIVLGADDCAGVASDGVIWRSTTPLVAN